MHHLMDHINNAGGLLGKIIAGNNYFVWHGSLSILDFTTIN